MIEIGIREARKELATYLKQVAHGNKIRLTNRGKVVAVIVMPVEAALLEKWEHNNLVDYQESLEAVDLSDDGRLLY